MDLRLRDLLSFDVMPTLDPFAVVFYEPAVERIVLRQASLHGLAFLYYSLIKS